MPARNLQNVEIPEGGIRKSSRAPKKPEKYEAEVFKKPEKKDEVPKIVFVSIKKKYHYECLSLYWKISQVNCEF